MSFSLPLTSNFCVIALKFRARAICAVDCNITKYRSACLVDFLGLRDLSKFLNYTPEHLRSEYSLF
jgi:hypothetical protein